MREAMVMHQQHALSEADVRRIAAESLAYGTDRPNRKQRKARAVAQRRSLKEPAFVS